MPSSDTNKNAPGTVCLLSTQAPFVWGGAESVVATLHEELIARGYETDVVNVPFKWYPPGVVLKHALAWRSFNLDEIAGKKIGLVIATKFPTWALKHSNKVVWLVHQMRQVYDFYGTEWNEFSQNVVDQTIRRSVMKLDSKCLGECKKIYTISKNVSGRLKRYNGIDSTPLYPPPRNNDLYRNDGYGDFIICTGRLVKLKRVEFLVQAMKHVKSRAKCVIIGTGEEEEPLKKMAVQLGVTDKVEFAGFLKSEEKLLEYYARCFAVYYSPVDEDYGLTTVEAFKSEKPVLTMPDSGGTLEFVEDQVNGFVTPKDPRAVAEKIDWLFEHRDRAAEFGKKGLAKVRDINWDTVVRALTSPQGEYQ